MNRRHFLIAGAALAPSATLAQTEAPGSRALRPPETGPVNKLVGLEPLIESVTKGAPTRPGRVDLRTPILADNGNSVEVRIAVQSPMTAGDHVRAVHLLSERNPVKNIATFHLGPRAGRAEVQSRIRLAGSQRIVAVAEMSDGSFWTDVTEVVVTASACIDGS